MTRIPANCDLCPRLQVAFGGEWECSTLRDWNPVCWVKKLDIKNGYPPANPEEWTGRDEERRGK